MKQHRTPARRSGLDKFTDTAAAHGVSVQRLDEDGTAYRLTHTNGA